MSQPYRETRSRALFDRATHHLVGGVSSPVRAFGGVGGAPICMARGQGAILTDVDDNEYIDHVLSFGPLLLGHAPAPVVQAVTHAAQKGTTFGATVEGEVLLAEMVKSLVPSIEKIRFVSSGTEATMSAVRLARGATKRNKIIKFAGCYHGHADVFLVDEAGSGLATLGLPGSAGVTSGATQDTITVAYNDLDAARTVATRYRDDLAAIIVEPIACNMGLVEPAPGFLPGLRALCDEMGALLIFDEVITGFRVAPGGAQELFGMRADLTTFGKIMGGGLPVGAYGGAQALMDEVAPLGPVYQAGTLSGNPVAMAAGLAMLTTANDPQLQLYPLLDALGAQLEAGINDVLARHDHPAYLSRVGSIFHLWWAPQQSAGPRNYDDIKRANKDHYARFFRALLRHGVSIAPSAFEVGFVSGAHTTEHIARTIDAMDHALTDARL